MSRESTVEVLENVFKTLIEQVGLEKILVALHNSCIHGEVFNGSISDEGLEKLFNIYDKAIKLARKEEL
jgi:hypothetical protein